MIPPKISKGKEQSPQAKRLSDGKKKSQGSRIRMCTAVVVVLVLKIQLYLHHTGRMNESRTNLHTSCKPSVSALGGGNDFAAGVKITDELFWQLCTSWQAVLLC